MKKILFKVAFFLFEIGVAIIINLVFGKESRKALEKLVEDLDWDSELSSTQKYNRAKKFLDNLREDAPDVIKNIAIEAIVAKVSKKGGLSILQKIK